MGNDAESRCRMNGIVTGKSEKPSGVWNKIVNVTNLIYNTGSEYTFNAVYTLPDGTSINLNNEDKKCFVRVTDFDGHITYISHLMINIGKFSPTQITFYFTKRGTGSGSGVINFYKTSQYSALTIAPVSIGLYPNLNDIEFGYFE